MRVLTWLGRWLLMAVEVLRKLVSGVWKTVVEDAGGGGALPAQWTIDEFGNLVLAPSGDVSGGFGNLHIVASAGSQDCLTGTDAEEPNSAHWGIDPFGYFSGAGAAFQPGFNVVLLKLIPAAGDTHDIMQVILDATKVFSIDNAGGVHILTGTSVVADL